MRNFGQLKYFTLFCLIFSYTLCFAEWCNILRINRQTVYCVNYREECREDRESFCIENNKSKALEANQLPFKESSYGDIQYCTYWRDTHKVNSCHNSREDCRENSNIYCRVVKVKWLLKADSSPKCNAG